MSKILDGGRNIGVYKKEPYRIGENICIPYIRLMANIQLYKAQKNMNHAKR